MQLTKRQTRITVLAMILCFFGIGVFMINTQSNIATEETSLDETPDELAETPPLFELNKFHRSETKNGKLAWEVIGEKGQFIPTSNSAKVQIATIWMYRPDGSVVEINAEDAEVFFSGAGIDYAVAKKNVVLKYDNRVEVYANKARFESKKNLVFIPGKVKIVSGLMEITGADLEANLETQKININEHEETFVKPRKSGALDKV